MVEEARLHGAEMEEPEGEAVKIDWIDVLALVGVLAAVLAIAYAIAVQS